MSYQDKRSEIAGLFNDYWKSQISHDELIRKIKNEIGWTQKEVRHLIAETMKSQSADDLEAALVLLFAFEKGNDMTDLIHQLLLEHRAYEELVHELQRRKRI